MHVSAGKAEDDSKKRKAEQDASASPKAPTRIVTTGAKRRQSPDLDEVSFLHHDQQNWAAASTIL